MSARAPVALPLGEDELLALLPPFERATARRAVRAVVEATRRGLTLRGVAREAAARLVAERRRLAESADAAARDGLARHVAQREAEVRCALLAARRISHDAGTGAESLVALAVELTGDPSWRVVSTAFDVLTAEAKERGAAAEGARAQALALAGDPRASVWSQVAAWRFLADVAALEGEGPSRDALASRLAARLAARESSAADDLFVRADVARLLGRGPAGLAVPALEGAALDPSEHVRMAAVGALGLLGAGASLRRFAHARSEPSPRVRAAAVIALAPLEPDALGLILLSDPSELPRRAALEEAERRAPGNDGLRVVIDEVAVSAPWPRLAALAADAAERLHHRADRDAARALEALRGVVASIPVGGTRELPFEATSDVVGRALAVLSADDYGVTAEALGAARWRLTRGEPERRRLWRILHELRHPSPDKRQSHLHTIGRVLCGQVRAPTGILAEVSPTRVPGERVVLPSSAGWGRHLPSVDDLLERPPEGELAVFSSVGVARLGFPTLAAWGRTRAGVMLSYAALARLRQQSLEASESQERGAYGDALRRLGFRLQFQPHRVSAGSELVELFAGAQGTRPARVALPSAAMLTALPITGALGRLSDLLSTDLSGLHTANQVAAVGAVALGVMGARLYEARREIDRARASIPLSIGGWGTRGKSGTERLKAALFQALGCEVFAKTTGCEAMFLHAIPDQKAEEIFLYRTYDKATIWEQRDTLRLASRLGVDVYLWECMALNPIYVDLLERRWMRDDLCTLTNAYPDHENVQGPTGMDVARVMSEFIPRGKTLVTAEEQMLPVLREAARERDARLLQVGWRDVELLPEDVLARFPYREHPRNIALVLALAAELGVERDVALKEMADWIVPDLGVLKTYPEASWRGRRLEFSNGMSANERTGFLGSWSRLGFDTVGPDAPGTWVVTVINNRGDRNARSAVFADILARDIAAHRHVVIGTNVRGFVRRAEAAFAKCLKEVSLVEASDEPLPPGVRAERAIARAARVWARLQVGALGPARLAREASDIAAGLGVPEAVVEETTFAAAFQGASSAKALEDLRAEVATRMGPGLASFGAALGEHGEEATRHLVDLTAKHVAILRWQSAVRAALAAEGELEQARTVIERSFRALAAELFRATLVVVSDPTVTGDQIIDLVATATPPGLRSRVLGAQNIKGTGLDFAYRWVALDRTVRAITELETASDERALSLALELLARDDLGILDFAAAEPALRSAAARAATPVDRTESWNDLLARLSARGAAARAALGSRVKRRPLMGAVERVLDVWDGVLRKFRAGRIVEDLVAGRRSHAETATAMRALVARQKGGWLGARSRPAQ